MSDNPYLDALRVSHETAASALDRLETGGQYSAPTERRRAALRTQVETLQSLIAAEEARKTE